MTTEDAENMANNIIKDDEEQRANPRDSNLMVHLLFFSFFSVFFRHTYMYLLPYNMFCSHVVFDSAISQFVFFLFFVSKRGADLQHKKQQKQANIKHNAKTKQNKTKR